MLDAVNENGKIIDGEKRFPRMYGDEGWYDFRPEPFSPGALELYFWSMNPDDRSRIIESPWLSFLDGDNPAYPVSALRSDMESVRRKIEMAYDDDSTPDTRMSDDMNGMNPATTDALIQLTLGGVPTGRVGYPLHCRLRYFDPERRRAGLPEDVAALVDTLTAGETGVSLINLNQVKGRKVIVQGGAYAEHGFESISVDGSSVDLEGSSCSIYLAPGCGGRLKLAMRRYVHQPVLRFPW